MMTSIKEATSLNNKGAHHLILNRNCPEAISSLLGALFKAKELLRCASQQPQLRNAFPSNAEGLQLEFVNLECNSQDSIDCASSSGDPEDSRICESVIIIHQDTAVELSARGLQIITFSAVYNLAVSSHLIGRSQRSPQHLRQALQFYELSYHLQLHEPFCSNLKLVPPTIYNNMAMIYRTMGDDQTSNELLRLLHSAMNRLQNLGQRTDDKNWTIFISNVVGLCLGPPSAAPSA